MEEKLRKVLIPLLTRNPFFGRVILDTPMTFTKQIGTAATDGRRIMINESFFDALSMEERMGLLLHEALHIILEHPYRGRGYDPMIHNLACDAKINWMIKKAGFTLPEGGVFRDGVDEKSTEQIYFELLDKASQSIQSGDQSQGNQGGEGEEGVEEGNSNSSSSGKNNSSSANKSKKSDGSQPWGEHDVWGTAETLTPKEKEAAKKEVLERVKAAMETAGDVPAEIRRAVEEGLIRQSRVNWKDALARFIQPSTDSDWSWQAPDTRMMAGFEPYIYPSLQREEKVDNMTIVIDTSGSIDEDQLHVFLSEVLGIYRLFPKEMSLFIIFCDCEINAVHKVEEGQKEVDLIKIFSNIEGGGGTSFVPPFEWIKTQNMEVASLVYFTDMFGEFPDESPNFPVLWVIEGNSAQHNPPFGEIVEIS